MTGSRRTGHPFVACRRARVVDQRDEGFHEGGCSHAHVREVGVELQSDRVGGAPGAQACLLENPRKGDGGAIREGPARPSPCRVHDLGGALVVDGSLTIGTLLAFTLYLTNFFDPVQQLSQLYNTFLSATAALDKECLKQVQKVVSKALL